MVGCEELRNMAEEKEEKAKKECEFLRNLAANSTVMSGSDNDNSSTKTKTQQGKRKSFTPNTAYFFICLLLGFALLAATSKTLWAITSWLPKILQGIAVVGLGWLAMVFLLPFFVKFGNFAEKFLKSEQEDNKE